MFLGNLLDFPLTEPSLAPIMESSWYSSTDCADSKMNTVHSVTVYWQVIEMLLVRVTVKAGLILHYSH